MNIRTRFAPSPTGHVHIGNMRVAIFNWLFARHTGGKFLLRIENTDTERSTDTAVRTLLQAMEWLGLDIDQKPLYQTTRTNAHLAVTEQLLASGHAYKGDKGGLGRGDCVIFKMPHIDKTFHDEVKGTLKKSTADMADFVIVRSNGTPVFHLANVLDDIEQGITHVIRGDDHVENTFRHLAIYQALGAPIPKFAHLPMIINAQGKPYSKRDGDAFVGDFKTKGFLSDALFNYLALLGWSPGDDREILTRKEMIEAFHLNTIRPSPAQMDLRKLLWMNGEYIRSMKGSDFAVLCRKELKASNVIPNDQADAVFALMQQRIKRPADILPTSTFFFNEKYEYDPKAVRKKLQKKGVFQTLEKVVKTFQRLEPFNEESVNKALHQIVEESGHSFRAVMLPVRIAVSGQQSGPDLAPILAILGKKTVLTRIAKTLTTYFP